jgi:hypothetical protein
LSTCNEPFAPTGRPVGGVNSLEKNEKEKEKEGKKRTKKKKEFLNNKYGISSLWPISLAILICVVSCCQIFC